ncbi:thiamine-binding protein [Nocardioides sp. Y6]|uniref:Thiamine-binding protein n=1 Tax=Nocardioides malaquae TaxID=2773426 RepID=A0ABR9RNG9_9ACTN|nr:thiamine-binding protein [Nocardioides malaquae]
MIVAISISPSGADETGGVAAGVAEAVRVIRDSGLPHETNAMFTNIEGEWVKKRNMATTAPTYLKEIA